MVLCTKNWHFSLLFSVLASCDYYKKLAFSRLEIRFWLQWFYVQKTDIFALHFSVLACCEYYQKTCIFDTWNPVLAPTVLCTKKWHFYTSFSILASCEYYKKTSIFDTLDLVLAPMVWCTKNRQFSLHFSFMAHLWLHQLDLSVPKIDSFEAKFQKLASTNFLTFLRPFLSFGFNGKFWDDFWRSENFDIQYQNGRPLWRSKSKVLDLQKSSQNPQNHISNCFVR